MYLPLSVPTSCSPDTRRLGNRLLPRKPPYILWLILISSSFFKNDEFIQMMLILKKLKHHKSYHSETAFTFGECYTRHFFNACALKWKNR